MATISRLRTAAESTVEESAITERNQALVRKMKICLSDAEQRKRISGLTDVEREACADAIESSLVCFDELRSISGEFRSGSMGGGEYARRLFGIFGYKDASAGERSAVDDVLVELLALLPDPMRRRELAAALVDCLERMSLEERHVVDVSGRSSGARRGRENVRQGSEGTAASVGQGAAMGASAAVLEPEAFPSLDGSEGSSASSVFGGAWLSRPRRPEPEPAGLRSDSGPAAASYDAEEAFPVLREAGRDPAAYGPTGAWGGERAQVEPAAPPAAAPATRKTKRGTQLLF
jgi:hypothetical protein